MLRLVSYDIVFQEVPDEVALALNLSGCPNRCAGCHSPHLQQHVGAELNENLLTDLLARYGKAITCLCFMGGDAAPHEVLKLAQLARRHRKKTAWYSGSAQPHKGAPQHFDYLKLGKYIEALGGLRSPTTNQRFYRVEEGRLVDETRRFLFTI